MTVSLSEAILAAKTREQIARWDAAEAKLLNEFGFTPPKTSLSADVLARLDIWGKWTASKHVRKCPAKPYVVAAFVIEQDQLGASSEKILAMVEAIAQLHSYHELSNPTTTSWVYHVLNEVVKADPPRSWNKAERAQWAMLPPQIRDAITYRENQRDKELRRTHSELAELRRQSNGAVKPAHSSNKEKLKCAEHGTTV